ncbi:sulfotransferase domain-containing protein [Planktotalea sp.]|uniref:sulfotransferase domain-containing protein n=1 Tax=Planktotalea sp. TaxID=2029877 RepID=UPI00329A244B
MTTIKILLERLSTGQQLVVPSSSMNVQINGKAADLSTEVSAGDRLQFDDKKFRVVNGLEGYLYPALEPETRVKRTNQVHCGLHKSLTMFTRRVYDDAIRAQQMSPMRILQQRRFPQQKHFFHFIRDFYEQHHKFTLCSLSGQRLDLDSFDDIKIVRFVRDPRDLLISGYHYHKRGAEHWCKIPNAVAADYEMVNGAVPSALAEHDGATLENFLNDVDMAAGLAAELEFRRPHFESMMSWPLDDPRILTFRYEDIMDNEPSTFEAIAEHFGWTEYVKRKAMHSAFKYSAGQQEAEKGHVRDKTPGQWRKVLPEALNAQVIERYGPFLRAFNYPVD